MKLVSHRVSELAKPDWQADDIFHESRSKLHWARVHTYNLSESWHGFFELYHRSSTRLQFDDAKRIDYRRIQTPIPMEIPLILGDAIRNMRCSLDYLVSVLARNAHIPDNNTIFPFSAKSDGLKSSFAPAKPGDKHRKSKRAGALYEISIKHPELENVIMNIIQPYSADDGAKPLGDLLWRLITSDNIDKHRLIMPTTQSTSIGRAEAGNTTFRNFTIIGNPPSMFEAFQNSDVDNDADFEVDILFQEPTKLAGKPVISTLVEVGNFIDDIIGIFSAKFQPQT